MGECLPKKLIDLDLTPEEVPKIWSHMPGWIFRLIEKVAGIKEANQAYEDFLADESDDHSTTKFARAFGFQFEVEAESFEVPQSGPLIVIANHAYTPVDGFVLTSFLSRFRSDFKCLANEFLKNIKGLDCLILVSPINSPYSNQLNTRAVRQSLRHLMNRGSLVMFPSGEVSTFSWKTFRQEERSWSTNPALLARKSNAAVLPVYIRGSHSLLFQIVFSINPRAANLLLLRELKRARKQTLRIRVGQVLTTDTFEKFKTDAELTRFFFDQVYALR